MLAWYKGGADPQAFPSHLRNKELYVGLLVIHKTGDIHNYEHSPYPVKFAPQQFAIGSGRDFALAAMYLGHTAAEAVGVVSKFDWACGDGVDVLRFGE